MRGRTFVALASAFFVAAVVACSSDPSGEDLGGSSGAPALDAGGGDANPVSPDSGSKTDSGGTVDSGPPDKTPPMAINDLAATAVSHTAIDVTWTAPTDPPSGKVSIYDFRRSKTPITSDAEFSAATQLNIASPNNPGVSEKFAATGLEPETTYYFAIKAKDAAGNVGPMSNVASATTKARATVLLSEVAMTNPAGADGTPGYDFIELVVTKAGNLKDVEVKQSGSPASVHKFADFDVALGDRIVVHLTGLPGPTNFAQEDAAKSKTASTETAAFGSVDAFDVYSSGTGLVGTDNLISVVDGATVLDAVAYSGRDGDAAAASMTAFAAAKANASWTFTAVPADGTNDCETQREAVGVSTSYGTGVTAGTCGRFATGIGANKSINRIGTTDTNGKKDWYVAAATPGAANSAVPAPSILGATPTSTTSVNILFSQEIDSATVALNVFTGSGVTFNAATLSEPSVVTLTTSTQNGPHGIGIDAALKTIYGASVPSTVRFCGYEPLGGMIALTEFNPTITGADLVELKATRAGDIGGFGVRENPTAASGGGLGVSIPAGFCVALDDVIVVHMEPATLPAMPNETLAKNEVPTTTEPTYYDTAWDLRGGGTGLVATDSVIAVRDASGTYVDAVVVTNADGTSSAAFIASLTFVQGLGLWLPADCGGVACTDATVPTAQGVAASRVGVANTSTGSSLVKSSVGAARTAASWSVGASSWGQ